MTSPPINLYHKQYTFTHKMVIVECCLLIYYETCSAQYMYMYGWIESLCIKAHRRFTHAYMSSLCSGISWSCIIQGWCYASHWRCHCCVFRDAMSYTKVESFFFYLSPSCHLSFGLLYCCLRGRYTMKVYPKFIWAHGKTYDYKIPLDTINRLFLLPHNDQRQMFFVVCIDLL